MQEDTQKNGPEAANSPDSEKKKVLQVVCIGASAGGLEAIQEFFQKMPVDTGLAFVVIQHLSPDYKSLMDELLARYTSMKIFRVEDGMEPGPNSVYLIPPKHNMTIWEGKLRLTEQKRSRGSWLNLPIDIFLRSLAQEKGKNAIGIILSGTGSDGTLGIRAIKEVGGMVMVQDDESAKFNGMPRSSISTGMVDYVLPPAEMPQELINYIAHPYINKSKEIKKVIHKEEDLLAKIIYIIREQTGVDFSFYKENTIIRRLEKRISINQVQNIQDYVEFLVHTPGEVNILYQELLIGVTRFFRDYMAYDVLREKVFPRLLEKNPDRKYMRLWSVACSTGEEAYSLAITLKEFIEERGLKIDIKIFATDIDKESIEIASTGIYPESIVSDVSQERLNRFFVHKDEGYQISETIRKMVIFASHNVLKDPPFSKIDLITCRNLLIYFKPEMQQKILSMFYYSLRPSGFLFLGSSETVGNLSKGFRAVDPKWRVFEYHPGIKPDVGNNFMTSARSNTGRDTGNWKQSRGRPQERYRLEAVFEDALKKELPPSVILDSNFDIIHTLHDVNNFIKFPTGKINLNIFKMVSEDLSIVLGGLTRRAKNDRKRIMYEDVEVETHTGKRFANITCTYLYDKQAKQDYYLVSFSETQERPKEVEHLEALRIDDHYNERLNELEKELQYTKESWQATVEELETSNQELQSSNEELIASNEELQSTNEELQSVNEELYTVNSEHQKKNEELTQLYSDLDNLLRHTAIGVLFMDRNLLIRRFTPVVTEITNIRSSDIGRPIHHISLDNLYSGFLDDVDAVIKDLQTHEREILLDDVWYLVKVLPYRTQENAVDGVAVTFIDISRAKSLQVHIQQERSLLLKVLNNSPLAKVMLDKNGLIVFANKLAIRFLELGGDGEDVYFEDYPLFYKDKEELKRSQLPLRRIAASGEDLHKEEYLIEIKDKLVPIRLYGSPVLDAQNAFDGAVFTIVKEEG